MIADFDTLCRLSARQRPSAVKNWLQSKGILYWLNADNQPVTTDKALNQALLKGRKTVPNWPVGKQK